MLEKKWEQKGWFYWIRMKIFSERVEIKTMITEIKNCEQ